MSQPAVESQTDFYRQQARQAKLRYVYDSDPGISRRKNGKSFSYIAANGQPVTDETVLARIKTLALPPAWQDVWICPHENGHLQATGLDSKGRKQYRYHARWREAQDKAKFETMLVFGEALPAIRRRALTDLNLEGLPKERIVAAIIRMLDRTGLRVGNDAYSDENGTFGITTLHKKHVDIDGCCKIELDFPGKDGKVWQGAFSDPKVAEVIRQCEDIPGYRLFKYIGADGERHDVGSDDVNQWLQTVTGEDVTAKDFRTWNACVLFLEEAIKATCCNKTLPLKKVLKAVADTLGNTPAILQKSYVHPELCDLYRTGCFAEDSWQLLEPEATSGLRKYEALLLHWLKTR